MMIFIPEVLTLDEKKRCTWAQSPAMFLYHDQEWGVPQHDDCVLFEFLTLEGAQAGLSWSTILAKREAYRQAFSNFDPGKVARFDAAKQQALMANAGIVRNKLKIASAIQNAIAFLSVQREFGSFEKYVWQFVNGQPIVNSWKAKERLPAQTAESEKMSKDLLRRGFKFVGPTICYAFMQAVGLVNDHQVECFRFAELTRKR
jgi:DNA-3-methyladenine glycosylase I